MDVVASDRERAFAAIAEKIRAGKTFKEERNESELAKSSNERRLLRARKPVLFLRTACKRKFAIMCGLNELIFSSSK